MKECFNREEYLIEMLSLWIESEKITPKMVKLTRKYTGAGMLVCKHFLLYIYELSHSINGDFIEILIDGLEQFSTLSNKHYNVHSRR